MIARRCFSNKFTFLKQFTAAALESNSVEKCFLNSRSLFTSCKYLQDDKSTTKQPSKIRIYTKTGDKGYTSLFTGLFNNHLSKINVSILINSLF
jgi:hypothetical protein